LIVVEMGFFDSWSDLVAAATPWSAVEAEAASGGSENTPAPQDAETKVCWLFPFYEL
jgi:ubiquinol-cytochrome c reductase subunit 6